MSMGTRLQLQVTFLECTTWPPTSTSKYPVIVGVFVPTCIKWWMGELVMARQWALLICTHHFDVIPKLVLQFRLEPLELREKKNTQINNALQKENVRRLTFAPYPHPPLKLEGGENNLVNINCQQTTPDPTQRLVAMQKELTSKWHWLGPCSFWFREMNYRHFQIATRLSLLQLCTPLIRICGNSGPNIGGILLKRIVRMRGKARALVTSYEPWTLQHLGSGQGVLASRTLSAPQHRSQNVCCVGNFLLQSL